MIVVGKGYDLTTSPGREMWEQVLHRLQAVPAGTHGSEPPGPMYGDPTLVRQRLGQGAFRILVADVYERRCAITRERALPTGSRRFMWCP